MFSDALVKRMQFKTKKVKSAVEKARIYKEESDKRAEVKAKLEILDKEAQRKYAEDRAAEREIIAKYKVSQEEKVKKYSAIMAKAKKDTDERIRKEARFNVLQEFEISEKQLRIDKNTLDFAILNTPTYGVTLDKLQKEFEENNTQIAVLKKDILRLI